MGDASIIARLLANGHVQYGWSGNGGYFSMVGIRLLLWYQEPKNVEYLFSLGQTSLIGKIGSEKGGFNCYFGESVAVVWEAAVKVSKKISLSILSPPAVTDIIFIKYIKGRHQKPRSLMSALL